MCVLPKRPQKKVNYGDRSRRHLYPWRGLAPSRLNWPEHFQEKGSALSTTSLSTLKNGGSAYGASGATSSSISRVGPDMASRVLRILDINGEPCHSTSQWINIAWSWTISLGTVAPCVSFQRSNMTAPGHDNQDQDGMLSSSAVLL